MNKIKKFAVIGTSCSGKTTLVYNVVGALRKQGMHIEGLTSTDRIYPFEQKKLDYMHEAQSYIVLQQSHLETRISVRDDVDAFLCDRSTVDFFAYYEYFLKDPKNIYYNVLKSFAFNWAKTYDALFYLEPLPWINDNKRPADDLRLGVDYVIQSYLPKLKNLIRIPINSKLPKKNEREDFVMATIRRMVGESKE